MKFTFIILICTLSCFSQQNICNNDFNIKGHVKKVVEIDTFSGYKTKTEYTLNYDDFIISIKEPIIDSLINNKKFKYDRDNIIKEIKVTNSKGKIISKSTFIKNKNNQIVKTITKDLDEKKTIIHDYEGLSLLPVGGKLFNKRGISHLWKLEYNRSNLVSVMSIYSFDGILKNRTEYLYNTNNDIIEVTDEIIEVKLIDKMFYEYVYDNKGNWIERKIYNLDKSLNSTSKREITYW